MNTDYKDSYRDANTSPASPVAAKSNMVTGMFSDRDSAERAYKSVTDRGYDKGDVNLVMSDATRNKHFSTGEETELATKAGEGAGIGSAVGGAVGAIAGAVAAIGTTLTLPGLGVIIAGPLAAAIAGLGAGGLTGGIVGALVGWGIPEERIKNYQASIENGGILMGVKTKSADDSAHFEKQWKGYSGQNIYAGV